MSEQQRTYLQRVFSPINGFVCLICYRNRKHFTEIIRDMGENMELISISIRDLLDKRLNPHNKIDFKTAKRIYETLTAKKTGTRKRSRQGTKRKVSVLCGKNRYRRLQRQPK